MSYTLSEQIFDRVGGDDDDDNDDDDEDDNFELNSATVGKVTFPQREGNEGEVATSLSINYIYIHHH